MQSTYHAGLQRVVNIVEAMLLPLALCDLALKGINVEKFEFLFKVTNNFKLSAKIV